MSGVTKVHKLAEIVLRFETEVARLRREAAKKEKVVEAWRRLLRKEEAKAEAAAQNPFTEAA